MRFWKRSYFCPRDEVAFIPGETSVIPLREMRPLFYAEQEQAARFAPWWARRIAAPEFPDFSPMPEEFADFAQMLEEAKEKNGTLICFKCGHHNPVGQSQCEECGAWVPQTAETRWAATGDRIEL